MERPLQPINWLAELLISILVIALLVSLALPHYLRAIERARTTQIWSIISPVRAQVMEEYAARGVWPSAAPDLKLLGEGHVVERIELHPDAFTLHFNQHDPALAGHRFTLRYAHWPEAPTATGRWLCAAQPPPLGMQSRGVDRSDLPRHMLPELCLSRGTP